MKIRILTLQLILWLSATITAHGAITTIHADEGLTSTVLKISSGYYPSSGYGQAGPIIFSQSGNHFDFTINVSGPSNGDAVLTVITYLTHDTDLGALPNGCYTYTVNLNVHAFSNTTTHVNSGSFCVSGALPPVLDPVGNHTVEAGAFKAVNIHGSDLNGNSIFYSLSGAPAFISKHNFIDSSSGDKYSSIHINPALSDAGVYTFDVIATDSTGLTDTETITVTISSPTFSTWVNENFSNAQLSSGDANPSSDPEGDGNINALEYALDMDPNSASTAGLPSITVNGTNLEITFNRARDAANATYTVQKSSDLSTWTDVVTNPGTSGGFVTVTEPIPVYLRLQVSVP